MSVRDDHQQPRRRIGVRFSPAVAVALVLAVTGVASGDGDVASPNSVAVNASASVKAHAARALPRNSVGTAQLRRGAVHKVDIAPTTVKSLKGAKGDPGPQGPGGPQGPAGASATAYFTAVSGAGDFLRGNATSGGHIGPGHYTVGFARNVSACAYSVTLGSIDPTPPPAGTARAVDEGGRVGVYLTDMSNNPLDQMFYLTVTCAP
jgi:hypothetical protein